MSNVLGRNEIILSCARLGLSTKEIQTLLQLECRETLRWAVAIAVLYMYIADNAE